MNDIFHKLGYINLVVAIFLFIFVIFICIQDKYIRSTIDTLQSNTKVLDMQKSDRVVDESHHIPLYRQQAYSFKLEDFFIADIYKDMAVDLRVSQVQNDYFTLFTKAVDSILKDKTFFETSYKTLNDPFSLQFDSYIPLVKFAKYTSDYNTYLLDTSQQQFTLRVETKYNKFQTDPMYFSLLSSITCKKRVHIMFYIQKAIELYNNSTMQVNECILRNVCKVAPTLGAAIVPAEQCSL